MKSTESLSVFPYKILIKLLYNHSIISLVNLKAPFYFQGSPIIKDDVIKNRIYETLNELEDEVCDLIKQIKIETYQSICNVNYTLD